MNFIKNLEYKLFETQDIAMLLNLRILLIKKMFFVSVRSGFWSPPVLVELRAVACKMFLGNVVAVSSHVLRNASGGLRVSQVKKNKFHKLHGCRHHSDC